MEELLEPPGVDLQVPQLLVQLTPLERRPAFPVHPHRGRLAVHHLLLTFDAERCPVLADEEGDERREGGILGHMASPTNPSQR